MSAGAATPHVRVQGVSHRYGSVTALDDVSLDVRDGELVTLLGPSGCGKTTLLRVIAGLHPAQRGPVAIDGATSPASRRTAGR